ncbi:MAG: ankyrin repeat domain-containing protein, partial [Planctomycetaceae bacterium]|nr:ankyrin repeat domain-containing protein [Planctomycetaceae bacterium]
MQKTIFITLLTISFVSVLLLTGCGQKSDDIDDIFDAASKGDLKGVRDLVAQGADIKTPDKDGRTSLHFAAAKNSNVDVLKFLIEQGADVKTPDNDGRTPL